MRWDEYFAQVIPERKRQLRIYNVVNAPVRASAGLLTEQLYEPTGPGRCRLSFTLFFDGAPSVADELTMRVAAHEIARIFRHNIANIKRLTEQAAAAERA
jgi:hypothetical protein